MNGRRICAWCKKVLGPSQTDQDTHGICEECQEKYFRKPSGASKEKRP
jgi:hypothetical protein